MSDTPTLFRRTSDVFWQYPRLGLPLLVADAAKMLVIFLAAWLTNLTFQAMTPRSVLGGSGGISPNLLGRFIAVSVLYNVLRWAIALLVYLYGIGIVVRSVARLRDNGELQGALCGSVPRGLIRAFLLTGALLALMAAVFVFTVTHRHTKATPMTTVLLFGLLPGGLMKLCGDAIVKTLTT